jgi:hypothetical protein
MNFAGRRTGTLAAAVLAFGVAVFTCTDEPPPSVTVSAARPAFPAAYARGTLGIVEPTFARRYLVQTYRVLSGLPPVRAGAYPPTYTPSPDERTPYEWNAAREKVIPFGDQLERNQSTRTDRTIANYQWILNCTNASFGNAVRTLQFKIHW